MTLPAQDIVERLLDAYTAWNNPPSEALPEGAGVVIDAAATISRLTADNEALRKERDALHEYAHEATKAITSLTVGGSEYFGKRIGEMYTADLLYCVDRIRERMGYKMDAMRANHRADALAQEVERKDAALRRIAEGNLGDASWQANYDKIREVALAALGDRP